ncbi:MAG: hypothetical protein AB1571_02700 [Nanoarchaeota archaeon]
MAVAQQTIKKKKKWFVIAAPPEFHSIELGETLATDPESALNKILAINLTALFGDIKKQNMMLLFKTASVKDNKIVTNLIGYETLSSYVKKAIRSSKSRIEESFLCKAKDNVEFIVKPIVLLRFKLQNSVSTMLRKKLIEEITNMTAKQTFQSFLDSVVTIKLFKDLQKTLSKIYPVSSILIKSIRKVEKQKKEEKTEKEAIIKTE